ncbi:Zinc finger protein ZAT1 [Linum grandiflorum]
MEANQKKKFVCSYCNKRYPCGKSLGGHIRIHLKDSSSSYGNEDQAAAAAAGYILRENPKKTKKFEVDPNKNNNHHQHGLLKVCKECGKGFQSLKALCGHMACHSRNYCSYDSEEEDLVMDDDDDDDDNDNDEDQSDTETSTTPSNKRRRSKRMVRYRNIGVYGNGSGGSLSSSMASDLEQEQEEVALCLMMLSKDSGFKRCLSYVAAADSYDNNNSVVLEAKMRIKMKNSNSSSCYDDNDDNFMEMKVARKNKKRQVVMSSDGYDSDNSDSSGYFNYGPKKSESEVSHSDEVVKKVEFGDGFNDARAEIGGQQQRRIQHQMEPATPSKKKMVVNKSWNNNNGRKNTPLVSKKAKTHECPFCAKVFKSGQALGGHKRSHFIGASDHHDGNATVVIKSSASAGMIDLNLPAPVDEEQHQANATKGFVSW